MIHVEVAYATNEEQFVLPVELSVGATVAEAIQASGLLAKVSDIEPGSARVGIFSRPASLDTVLQDGDRVEIYRPLLIDPKEARRQRAKRRD